jgi:hypothetical protein
MVEAALTEGDAAACSINLGEVLYRQIRAVGPSAAKKGVAILRQDMKVICPNWELVVAAAETKARGGLSYADAFCVVTAERLGAPLWTGDPEIIELAAAVPGGIVDLRAGESRPGAGAAAPQAHAPACDDQGGGDPRPRGRCGG